jgi:hypothetical protein
MNSSGRGGDNRGNRTKRRKRRDKGNTQSRAHDTSKSTGKKPIDFSLAGEGRPEKRRGGLFDHPKWTPPPPPSVPLPTASCAWCDKPIKDMSAAFSEPDSGKPVHFDCVLNRITERENLENGDVITYIGGGRFGIVHYNNPPDTRDFKIKRVFEWENKEIRSEWRTTICDCFSVT